MRTLLTLAVAALLAGTVSAYAMDQQRSDAAVGYGLSHSLGGPADRAEVAIPDARAEVPTSPVLTPALKDFQDYK